MTDTNIVILTGRATRDAECKYTSGGTAVASFGLAVNRSWKKGDEWQEEVAFVDVTAWAKLAEQVCANVKKGARLSVVGRIKQDRWTDEGSGENRSRLGVVAESVAGLADWRREEQA